MRDEELEKYKRKIGIKRYVREYNTLYNQPLQNPNKRFSKRKYKNSKEKINQIKEKYKNGVTIEHIKEMFE